MRFCFCYKTTDGKSWGDFIDAPDWQSGLDAALECQGYQCGALVSVIDEETGAIEFDADLPPCPPYLRDHPAARMEP